MELSINVHIHLPIVLATHMFMRTSIKLNNQLRILVTADIVMAYIVMA